MVSNASDDLPLPLRPVMTTSLSRGMFSVRFFRLCSRAPPILMNSLLMAANFAFESIGKYMQNGGESKGGLGGWERRPNLAKRLDCARVSAPLFFGEARGGYCTATQSA